MSKLEHAGSLRRYECATDRRGTYTELTESGKEVFDAAEESYAAAVSEMMSSPAARELLAGLTQTKGAKAASKKGRR